MKRRARILTPAILVVIALVLAGALFFERRSASSSNETSTTDTGSFGLVGVVQSVTPDSFTIQSAGSQRQIRLNATTTVQQESKMDPASFNQDAAAFQKDHQKTVVAAGKMPALPPVPGALQPVTTSAIRAGMAVSVTGHSDTNGLVADTIIIHAAQQ